MGFKTAEAEDLLVRAGRMCAICHRPHGVQLHHIVERSNGGSDDIDNAIPLCANCHDEVHASGASGRVSRKYTVSELKMHRERVIRLAQRQEAPRAADERHDRELIKFFAQVLDRPAFRTPFHEEVSFEDFDRALEDTALALNTGYWRMRDGTPIRAAEGRITVINPNWRERLDEVAAAVEAARAELRRSLGLGMMLFQLEQGSRDLDRHLRGDRRVADEIDACRQRAVDSMNIVALEAGLQPLKGLHDW